ncbi:MAG: hypothetical protein EHM32_02905 [Spirochaetales bacterium]|nr:MAG: hypothetical protein EHM32_10405 [Spirochaetales bacterium]RPI96514.1 MAG: hypothetical protein EHM32_02905 [Spirochaetales bacterium]
MNTDLIKAHLNLNAVLVNLEDLVVLDAEMAALSKGWNLSVQFIVRKGPSAYIKFENGTCTVRRGRCKKPSVILYFFSPAHLVKMFDGKAQPVLLKGFTKLGFLMKDFPKLTARMEHYLKPTPELLADKNYLAVNTRFTITTAAFAIRELGLVEPVARMIASHIHKGVTLIKVLPNGPSAMLKFDNGTIEAEKGDFEKPMSAMLFRNLKVANDILNQKLDAFTAIATGDLRPRGQIGMIDSVSLLLDRIPLYLG